MITRQTCRVCEGSLEPILSLGEHYVSDFPDPGAPRMMNAGLLILLSDGVMEVGKLEYPTQTASTDHGFEAARNTMKGTIKATSASTRMASIENRERTRLRI